MSTNANIIVKGNGGKVILYQHWDANEIESTLARALLRGSARWFDSGYLARIIFCEMVKEDPMGVTGWAITPLMFDAGRNFIVNTRTQTVQRAEANTGKGIGPKVSFAVFTTRILYGDGTPFAQIE